MGLIQKQIHELFKAQSGGDPSKVSAPQLADRVMVRHADDILKDKWLCSFLLREALQDQARKYLQNYEYPCMRQDVAEQGYWESFGFPKEEVEILHHIQIKGVFSPSKGRHLPVVDSDPKSLRESADYYESQSKALSKRASYLRRLADFREGKNLN